VPEDLEVFVNNIQQEPGVGKSYTATGTTLTFDAAPSSGTGNVYVIYRGLAEVTRRLEHDPGNPLAATTGTFSGGLAATTGTFSGGLAGFGNTAGSSTSDGFGFNQIKFSDDAYNDQPRGPNKVSMYQDTYGLGISNSSFDLYAGNGTFKFNQTTGGASPTITERMRISGGNLLVGTTSTGTVGTYSGFTAYSDGSISVAATDNRSIFSRRNTDGVIVQFRKDGNTVGDVGVNNSDNLRIQGNSSHSGIEFGTNAIFPHKNGSNVDATIDLGESSLRFKDLYISNRITNSGSGGVRIDANNRAYIRKQGTHQYEFDCGAFTAGQGKKIFTTNSWTAGGGSITVFQNAGFFGVGQFSFILHYGGCAFTLQHGTSNYATFSVNLNTPGTGQTEVYLTMGYAMNYVKIFLNFDGYPYVGAGSLVNSAGSGITMTEVSHHTLA